MKSANWFLVILVAILAAGVMGLGGCAAEPSVETSKKVTWPAPGDVPALVKPFDPCHGACVAGQVCMDPDNNKVGECCTPTCDACGGGDGCGTVCDAPDCEDNNQCTDDSCNPATGCVNATVNCADNTACTNDSCAPATGCAHATINCVDANECTIDVCDGEVGCVHVTKTCNDSNACTTDSCDAVTGCAHAPVSCNDNDACTNDSCVPATGCSHAAVSCDDSDACTNDSCNAATGCAYAAVSCNDNDECTTDSCVPATGCAYAPVNCDDDDECTTDTCDPVGGCNHSFQEEMLVTTINIYSPGGWFDFMLDGLSHPLNGFPLSADVMAFPILCIDLPFALLVHGDPEAPDEVLQLWVEGTDGLFEVCPWSDPVVSGPVCETPEMTIAYYATVADGDVLLQYPPPGPPPLP